MLREKEFNIAKNLKYNVYLRGIAPMVHKIFDKNTCGSGMKKVNILIKKSAEELYKPLRKFEKNVNSSFVENIWAANLTDMQLISKFNEGICFLFCVIDYFH